MYKFYNDLKDFILKQDQEVKNILIQYYETLFQLESFQEIKELLTQYENGSYIIDYNEPDDHDYSSNGWFEIYNMSNSTSYNIELDIGDMRGSYCQCTPDDAGYNSDKNCCGVQCDAHLPGVSIIKTSKVISYEFQGHECDLWKLEKKWLTDFEKESLHKKKAEKVISLEAQIEQLQKELNVVKSQL